MSVDNTILNSTDKRTEQLRRFNEQSMCVPFKKVAEYVREKILRYTSDEVPHAITCITENIKTGRDATEVDVLIIVERENLKKIIIGHQGEMIKKIGIEARKDIEEMYGRKVYLNLFVKTVPKWRDKEKYLIEFGFKEEE